MKGHHLGCRARASAPLRPRRPPVGLTLLEALVVFVLVALLGATVVQGIGFFSSQYARAQRNHGVAFAATLRQQWFLDTVQGLHPYGMAARRFVGDGTAFAGFTLQPLFAEPGMPVRARWSIVEGDAAVGQQVSYQEDGGAVWPVFAAADANLAFQYADAAGEWHERWPLDAKPLEWVPTLIRLRSATRGDLWLAHVAASPMPLYTEAMLR